MFRLLIVFAVLTVPTAVLACPVCATGESERSAAADLALAGFVAAPFAIALVAGVLIWRVIKKH